MYITGTTPSGESKVISKKAIKPGSGGFSGLLSSGDVEEASTHTTSGVSSLNSLLFMQEVGDEEYQRKEAVKHGFDVLKYLDNIRINLLCGTLSKETIFGLDSVLQKIRKNFNDPHLSKIIDEIELRAMVEIAKLESN